MNPGTFLLHRYRYILGLLDSDKNHNHKFLKQLLVDHMTKTFYLDLLKDVF